MRVLVTGADGFVGRHLVAYLRERGDTVIPASGPQAVNALAVEISDLLAVRAAVDIASADAVIHLAGQAAVPTAIANPVATFAVNATGTINLLEAIRAARDDGGTNPRVLVVGSADVYGRQPPERFPLGETAPLAPRNPYAASKAAAEAAASAWARTYDLNVVAARPFNHIGPGQDERFVVASFARQIATIAAGGPPLLEVGDLTARRDFLDVRDVVAAYAALLDATGDAGEVYNVCSGTAVEIAQVLRELVMIARVGVEIREDPARMRPSDTPLLVGDPAKLRAKTGWEPSRSLHASLRDIYQDARDRVTQVGV